jgi:hypothetical protein
MAVGRAMTVYVDNMRAPFGRLVMCHMIADTEEELLAMVDKIGIQRKWHQYPGTHRAHFDIALSKRALAVKAGAVEITLRQTGAMCMRRRLSGELDRPDEAEAWVSLFRQEFGKKMAEAISKRDLIGSGTVEPIGFMRSNS